MDEPLSAPPRAAILLTAAGAIPFVAGAALAHLGQGETYAGFDVAKSAAFAVQTYGAVILSFLGGIHWGMAIRSAPAGQASGAWLTFSVLPSLIAWPALLLPPFVGLLLLGLGFAAMAGCDLVAAQRGAVPNWYPRLRIPVITVVVSCILPTAPA